MTLNAPARWLQTAPAHIQALLDGKLEETQTEPAAASVPARDCPGTAELPSPAPAQLPGSPGAAFASRRGLARETPAPPHPRTQPGSPAVPRGCRAAPVTAAGPPAGGWRRMEPGGPGTDRSSSAILTFRGSKRDSHPGARAKDSAASDVTRRAGEHGTRSPGGSAPPGTAPGDQRGGHQTPRPLRGLRDRRPGERLRRAAAT